jgi:hypothetical protein
VRTIRLKVALEYDPDVMHGDDKEAVAWFYRMLLTTPLRLISDEIGDEVGAVKVLRIGVR